MTIQFQQLLGQLAKETESANEAIEKLQRQCDEQPARLAALAEDRTEAFVELARHYLPALSHETLAAAWVEVRQQIREILLNKDDQCRTLQVRWSAQHDQVDRLRREYESLQHEIAKARRDLLAKQGNARKLLAADPQVARWMQAIEIVDAEIDKALAVLDRVREDADDKLPDYEACSLFSYLKDRKFGTPAYQETGLERRWDRWVAKLINYKRAKSSFDHLQRAPSELQELVDQKREHYRQLLHRLGRVRSQAMNQFGVLEQTEYWESFVHKADKIDKQLQTATSDMQSLAAELARTQRSHYAAALDVYQRFLTELDTEVLRVYAECTASIVDDQICARLRRIGRQIDAEQQRNGRVQAKIVRCKKYLAGLRELAWRLHHHLHEAPLDVEIRGDFYLAAELAGLRRQQVTPSEIWRRLRGAIVRAVEIDTEAEARPLDASLLATLSGVASTDSSSDTSQQQRNFDPLDIVMLSPLDHNATGCASLGGFRALACCPTKDHAVQLSTLLGDQGILCFLHNHRFDGGIVAAGVSALDENVIMVDPRRHDDARQVIESLQQAAGSQWNCYDCSLQIDVGYLLCWQCGQSRRSQSRRS